ncbi:MAG: efflux RND transporter periplasmic adaptor subunit [Alphaproteobacteria bacterium]|nr:efflux RND transporter periplasmic adaptor subunit [Alphaproteobacteria bacterium]
MNGQIKSQKFFSKTVKLGVLIAWSCVCVGIGYYFVKPHQTPPPNMPVQTATPLVITGHPIQKDIRPFKTFIGFVEPINEVNLKPQISGRIDSVLFENGSFVETGRPLFIIDKRKYEANVQSAQATLNKANANVIQIENDYKRQTKLYKDKFLPKAELEIVESKLAQAKADVLQAQANLKLAQLDLEYATVTAPISGYISKALVTKGNYVDTNSATLARIVQTNPVRIAFSITDKERLQNLDAVNSTTHPLSVNMILADGKEVRIKPEKIFTDSETSTDTATMTVYIEYDNPNHLLLPGNVLTLQISDTNQTNAVLIPQTAILQDSNGKYVMKTNEAGIAQQQYIETTRVVDNMAVVDKGIIPTDTIIISGGQKVRSGQQVKSISAQ